MPTIRWTLDQKKHHIAAWRASGLTREQYCDLYDIPFKSLRQWPQDVAKAEQRANAPKIIPVRVSDAPAAIDPLPHNCQCNHRVKPALLSSDCQGCLK